MSWRLLIMILMLIALIGIECALKDCACELKRIATALESFPANIESKAWRTICVQRGQETP